MGELYINANDRDGIDLPDDFVASHGKKLIDAIARSLPKADLADKVTLTCKKISGEQARAIIDEELANAKKKRKNRRRKNAKKKRRPHNSGFVPAPRPQLVKGRCVGA